MKIILWRLGSLEHKIFPTDFAVDNFRRMVVDHIKENEVNHFVVGPEVDVSVVDVEDVDQYILAYKAEKAEEEA